MAGYTVVLIDDEDGSEGDFVYVESFPNLESLEARIDPLEQRLGSEGLADAILDAARQIDAPERRSTIYGAIE